MRVVLTGSSGFVGTALLQLFREKQIEVMTISHHHLYDLEEDARLAHELVQRLRTFQPDTFIHLAWRVEATSWWNADSQNSLITSTKILLNMLNDVGIMQSIGVGSCLEYFPSMDPIHESREENTNFQYTRDKLEMKRVLADHATQNGYISTWARFFFLYGSNDRVERLIPTLANKMALNLDIQLDNPDAVVDYLNVEDAAKALIVLARTRARGVYNIGSGMLVTPLEVASKLKHLAESDSRIFAVSHTPDRPKGFVANTAKLRALGWIPKVSLEEGLKSFLEIGVEYRK